VSYWIENCDDKWMSLKLECIDGYGIVDKNECGMVERKMFGNTHVMICI
jgi:hypothetical protein